jgi:RNA polymerase sporulation-specific sigma factor
VEGNEISLIDVLKSEGDDVIDTIQLNMVLEKVKKYIDVLDEREIAKELGISRSYASRIEKRAFMKMFYEFYGNEKEKRR